MYRLLALTLLGSAAAYKPVDRTLANGNVSARFYLINALLGCGYDNECKVVEGDITQNYLAQPDPNGTPLAEWDVSEVTSMEQVFYNKPAFNGDLSAWNVSGVTNMMAMFTSASAFNGDLSAWDVSGVTTMEFMFHQAASFNGDISTWDVGRVTNMKSMFYPGFLSTSSFNQDLSAWDVGQVTTITAMFQDVSAFNQDLCGQAWVDLKNNVSVIKDYWNINSNAYIPDNACDLCPVGFEASNGQDTCTACPNGKLNTVAGATICLDCPTDTPFSDGITCTACQPGTFAETNECKNCPIGYFRSESDDVNSCVVCVAGKYTSEEGQASCKNCENGHTSSNNICEACGNDEWSAPVDGRGVCEDRGSFTLDQLGDSACEGMINPSQCDFSNAAPGALATAVQANPTAYQMAGLCT